MLLNCLASDNVLKSVIFAEERHLKHGTKSAREQQEAIE